MGVLILFANFDETLLILRRTEQDRIQKYLLALK
jgi:hypothetical protein